MTSSTHNVRMNASVPVGTMAKSAAINRFNSKTSSSKQKENHLSSTFTQETSAIEITNTISNANPVIPGKQSAPLELVNDDASKFQTSKYKNRHARSAAEIQPQIDDSPSPGNLSTIKPSGSTQQESNLPTKTREQHSVHVQEVWPPPDETLLSSIRKALNWKQRPRTHPPFKFEMSKEAAEHNFNLLQSKEFDLNYFISAFHDSPIRIGSEFRPVQKLEPIFLNHPNWPRVRRNLIMGASMHLKPIPEDVRLQDLEAAIDYGNHKSALKNKATVFETLKEEVQRGWQLVLPVDKLWLLPDVVVSPVGMVNQQTINEHGEITTKWRLTHDQSFSPGSGMSANKRVITERLAPCLYGSTLRRTAHAVCFYRRKFPSVPILLSKVDLKSAYRRMHNSSATAYQSTITTLGLHDDETNETPLALVSLRMTFGGSPNPSEFSTLSEMTADLANALLQCKTWDPTQLHSEHHELLGESILANESDPFFISREMIVDPDLSDFGCADVYIDDLISVVPALSPEVELRGRHATLLSIDTVARPVSDSETLPRDPLVAIKKLLAEGTPTENLTVLGWNINTRTGEISLPRHKYIAWDADLQRLIEKKTSPVDLRTLEKIQGRDVNVSIVVHGASHFLNRFYRAIARAKVHGYTRLTREEREDLPLKREFLRRAFQGVDINTMTMRMPDHIGRSDAYEGGIGGFDLTTGAAWRLEIPPEIQHQKSQNFLEFLACVTTLLWLIQKTNWSQGDCFLSVGDNMSALRWMKHSNFSEDDEQFAHAALARYIARVMMRRGITNFTQWFPGKENVVADALSRHHDLSDSDLTTFLFSTYPNQVPRGFHLDPVPDEITSWALYWVRLKLGQKESPPPLTLPLNGNGKGGSSSSMIADSTTTPTWTDSHDNNATSCLAHSPNASENAIGRNLRQEMLNWLRSHAAPPLMEFARPSAQSGDRIPASTRMGNLHSFYSDK